jgi:hypothetical protein
MKKNYLLLALTMMTVQGVWAQELSGSGTSADPYLIKDYDDWYIFATNVKNGVNNYEGKVVKLEADLENTYGTMVGDMSHSFRGTFDGGGHTINFSTGNPSVPFAEDYCAPFRKVIKATIKNLKTTGTIYTSGKYAAGIVAQAAAGLKAPKCFFENCHSSMNIISSYEGAGKHGGLVAEGKSLRDNLGMVISASWTEFTKCSFYGSLKGENTTSCGGLMGFSEYIVKFKDCLFVPYASDITISATDSYTFGYAYNTQYSTIDNCFYLQTFGTEQGSKCYNLNAGLNFFTQLKAGNGETYYANVAIDGVQKKYYYDGDAMDLGISVKPANCENLVQDSDYVFSIVRVPGNTAVTMADLTHTGTYALTINAGTSGRCVGSSGPYQFTVTALPTGTGTADDPFIINDSGDWDSLAVIVAGGKSFSGKYLQLNHDINVWSMVGTDSEPFGGYFNGNGHKLTVGLGTANNPIAENNVAPFRFINSATIQNLVIDGAVYTAGQYGSCLVGKADGTCLIRNCKNVATLSSTFNGEGYHGSFVGKGDMSYARLRIQGCVFAGSLLGASTDHVGGFIGKGWAKHFASCLFAPVSVTMSGNGSGTLTLPYDYEGYPQDVFYTTTLGEAQGNPTYTISAGSTAYGLAFGNPTNTYDVSGIEAITKLEKFQIDGGHEVYTDSAMITRLLKYGDVCYGLADRDISFTLTNAAGLNNCSIAGDGGLVITPTAGTGGQYTFTMPEASVTVYALGTNAQVTVGSHELSSFCSPYDLNFTQAPEGLKAYVVSGFSPTTMSITLTQADYVPAGTGLVVTGAEGTYDVPIAATDKVWANLLVGVVAPTPITTTDNGYSNFILSNGSQGYNWYASAPGTLPAGKAYLRLPTHSVSNMNNARRFTWIFEDLNPTGIQEVQAADGEGADAWYTLDGVRLSGQPTTSGIYVRQGKKYVVK